MGFIKLTQTSGPIWVNTDHIITVKKGASGSVLHLTKTDDDGKSQNMVFKESLDDVMRLIQGVGVEIVRLPPG